MNLSILKSVIKPFLPAFESYLAQMSAPVDEGGYLQPGDNFVGLTIYQAAPGITVSAMSYRIDTSAEKPCITVTAVNQLSSLSALK